jgi:hypothetical protein
VDRSRRFQRDPAAALSNAGRAHRTDARAAAAFLADAADAREAPRFAAIIEAVTMSE